MAVKNSNRKWRHELHFLIKHHVLYVIIYRPEVHAHSSEVKGCNPFQKPVRANGAASHSHNSTNLIVRD